MSRIEFNPQSKNCLICGSDRLRNIRAQASDAPISSFVNIIECRNCNFAWQYPLVRTEEQSVQYFEAAYADGGQTQSSYFNEDRKREIAKLEFDFIVTLPAIERTLLDIGAGAGIFSEVAAENRWNVTAVDPAIDIDRLKNNPMIRTIKGTTEHIPNAGLFDIVTLWDVIEHATNPIGLICNAERYLKEGGWLVIETINYKSAGRVNDGTSHWMYQFDHRWYFSPESIKILLTNVGFFEFIFSNQVLRPGWKGNVSYQGPSMAHFLKLIVRDPLHLSMHLSKHSDLIRAKRWDMSGIEIFTIATRKPNIAT
jgi:2-polyprenyl-3-methyl-5-hydroxy-6-metoxy-1,4-benzoquinol methylase